MCFNLMTAVARQIIYIFFLNPYLPLDFFFKCTYFEFGIS